MFTCFIISGPSNINYIYIVLYSEYILIYFYPLLNKYFTQFAQYASKHTLLQWIETSKIHVIILFK